MRPANVVFAVVLALIANSVAGSQASVFFPVTARCKEYTMNRLSNSDEYTATYHSFLVPLMESKSVVGTVELSSDSMTKRNLLELWLGVKKQCYANAGVTSDLNGYTIDFLQKELGVTEILGADIHNGKLTVYYRDEPVK